MILKPLQSETGSVKALELVGLAVFYKSNIDFVLKSESFKSYQTQVNRKRNAVELAGFQSLNTSGFYLTK